MAGTTSVFINRLYKGLLLLAGVAGIMIILALYPRKSFSARSLYEYPATIADRETTKYPEGFVTSLLSHPLTCLYADEPYQKLTVEKIYLEYRGKEVVLLEDTVIKLPDKYYGDETPNSERHGPYWNKKFNWYWKYIHVFDVDPHRIFREEKIGNEFKVTLHLKYRLDEKEKYQALDYGVKVFRYKFRLDSIFSWEILWWIGIM